MAGISSSSLANNHLPLQSPETIPRPSPNRQLDLASEDFPGIRCIVPGVAEMGKVLAPSVNPFSCAIPVSNDPIRKNDRTIEFDAKPCEGTIKEELKEAINKKTLLPQSGKFHRKRRKPTATLHKACETQGSESTDGVASIGLGASSSCRYDSSLSLLTKKFLNLLLEASDGTLDLNKAAKELDETSPNGTEPSKANVGFQELLNGEESRRMQRMRLSGKKMRWVRLEGEDGAMPVVGALPTAAGKFGDEVERARKEKYDERLAWRRRTRGTGGGSTE